MSDRHQDDDFNTVPDNSESVGHIEKLNKEINNEPNKKNMFFEGEEEKKPPIAAFIEGIKSIFGLLKPNTGDDPGDDDGGHKDEDESRKDNARRLAIGVIAIAFFVLVGVFVLKLTSVKGNMSQQRAVAEAPDSSATSLFGDEFVPEVGSLKGQLMEQKELQKKLDEMEKKFEQRISSIMEENAKLKEENKKLREKQAKTMNDASVPDSLGDLPELPKVATNAPDKPISKPVLPGGVDPIASQLPSSLHSQGQPNYKYPANTPAGFAERYQVSSTPDTFHLGPGEEKINVYSPVKDAVKGGAEAVSNAVSTAGTPADNKGEAVAVIPATTIGKAVLLNGIDAPTGVSASKDPIPVVLQFQTDGHTASYFDNVPIKGCRLIASGFGDLSSERAYFRTERIVCVAEDGKAFSATADGYLLGEDGKAGLRGRLVSKQGSMIAKSFVAGMLQGFGDVIRANTQNTTISAVTGTTTYTPLSGKDLMRSGIGGGLGEATSRIADFYMKMAESVMPVLEIDASRKVEVVFSHDLKFYPLRELQGENGEGYWDIPYSGGK